MQSPEGSAVCTSARVSMGTEQDGQRRVGLEAKMEPIQKRVAQDQRWTGVAPESHSRCIQWMAVFCMYQV